MTGIFQKNDDLGMLWKAIGAALSVKLGQNEKIEPLARVSGGDINRAHSIRYGQHRFFVKLNHARYLDMFEAEAAGLDELSTAGALRCPAAITSGKCDGNAYLVLEHLDLGRSGRSDELGEKLALLHQTTSGRFGWSRQNTLGTTPQPNDWASDWVEFLRSQRIGYQLELARSNGLAGRTLESGLRLLETLDAFFATYEPAASLLHGDLWGGNYGFLADGEPVIFDPAVYFGDRETDLAMTELFGGFSPDFHAAYRSSWPLDEGYRVRRKLYQLYHVLNHFNLFGGGYGSSAGNMIHELLAEVC